MSVILLESAHAREARQSSRELVTVKNTEISHTPRQIFVGDVGVIEDLAMARAVHGLQSEFLLLHVKSEHAVFIMVPVSGDFPEVGLVHVGRHDLLEASFSVFTLDQSHQGLVDAGTMRQPEGGARGHLVPEEEFLVLADLAVVALGSFLQELLVFGEGGLVGEGDASNSLHRLILAVA